MLGLLELAGLWKSVGTAFAFSRGFFLHAIHSEAFDKPDLSLETMLLEVTTTQHRVVCRSIPLIPSPLDLVSPFFAHLREEKQTYSILVGVAAASSDAALHHRPPCACVSINAHHSYSAELAFRWVGRVPMGQKSFLTYHPYFSRLGT